MWVLRENLIGPNVGRWDYLNSREEMFRHDPGMVIPDPNTVTMTEPSMTYYTMRNALLALLAGGMPIGGMAAQMQNPQAPENDPKALRDIWFDKLRERLTGLFKIDGRLYVDGILNHTMHAAVALDAGASLVICVNPLVPVDVSSGVEDAPGLKNHQKLARFIASARGARAAQ